MKKLNKQQIEAIVSEIIHREWLNYNIFIQDMITNHTLDPEVYELYDKVCEMQALEDKLRDLVNEIAKRSQIKYFQVSRHETLESFAKEYYRNRVKQPFRTKEDLVNKIILATIDNINDVNQLIESLAFKYSKS